jgi:hypothetical protein
MHVYDSVVPESTIVPCVVEVVKTEKSIASAWPLTIMFSKYEIIM